MKRSDEREALSAELCEMLRKMRLSGMAEVLAEQLRDPNSDLVPGDARIAELVRAEWNLRNDKKFQRLLRRARLRYPDASIDDSIDDPERLLDCDSIRALSECGWVADGRNLLVTGSAGTGKTYVVNAICVSAMMKSLTVIYDKASNLIYEVKRADIDNRHAEKMKEFATADIVVIDDFGLMDLSTEMCRGLFEIIDSREGRKSTVVISQLPVGSWYGLFKDRTYADSCMDRLVHRAYRLEFRGRNMRNEMPSPKQKQ